MNGDSNSLFARLAQKMGWDDKDGQDKKLLSTTCKTPKGGTGAQRSASSQRYLSPDSEDDPDKENQGFTGGKYRQSLIESSDDDFDHFLLTKATPKTKTPSQKSCRAAEERRPIVIESSDDDDNFETFLQRVKTPKSKPQEKSESGSDDSLKKFIVDDYLSEDDFTETKSTPKVPTKSRTPAARPHQRKPVSQWESPVFMSDSDDEDSIVVKSTWRTRHTKPKTSVTNATPLHIKEESSPSPLSSPFPFAAPCPKRNLSEPSRFNESQSSDEEFSSLLERLKRKNKLVGTPGSTREARKEPPVSTPPVKGFTVPASKPVKETPQFKTPAKPPILKPVVSQTEPRHGASSRVPLCKTPGCFLHTLSNPGTQYGHQFKQNKEELTSRLYKLYNSSVFDNKLPSDMSVTWNNKMRKTAGYCISGRERGGGNRYARIQLSVKVCDSADRLRDTLIHEMCHAATWLINGVQDGHGSFWKLYARKATLAHPELPMVSRCHSYEINYKFQYQCTRCKNTIGRHSKSLDTARFVCALCKGQLELLTPSKPRAPTPFANFVKENYGSVRQELVGQSHAEVMRKLSADFALKTKLSQS